MSILLADEILFKWKLAVKTMKQNLPVTRWSVKMLEDPTQNPATVFKEWRDCCGTEYWINNTDT